MNNNVVANLMKLKYFKELYNTCSSSVDVQYSEDKRGFMVTLTSGMVVIRDPYNLFATKEDMDNISEFGRSIRFNIEVTFRFPKRVSDSEDLIALCSFCSEELLDYNESIESKRDLELFYNAISDMGVWVQ